MVMTSTISKAIESVLSDVSSDNRAKLTPVLTGIAALVQPNKEPEFGVSYRDSTDCHSVSISNARSSLTALELAKFAMSCANFINMDIRPSVDCDDALKVTVMLLGSPASVRAPQAILSMSDVGESVDSAASTIDTRFVDELDVSSNQKLWIHTVLKEFGNSFREEQADLSVSCEQAANQMTMVIHGFFCVPWNRFVNVLLKTKTTESLTIELDESNIDRATVSVAITVPSQPCALLGTKRKRADDDDDAAVTAKRRAPTLPSSPVEVL